MSPLKVRSLSIILFRDFPPDSIWRLKKATSFRKSKLINNVLRVSNLFILSLREVNNVASQNSHRVPLIYFSFLLAVWINDGGKINFWMIQSLFIPLLVTYFFVIFAKPGFHYDITTNTSISIMVVRTPTTQARTACIIKVWGYTEILPTFKTKLKPNLQCVYSNVQSVN